VLATISFVVYLLLPNTDKLSRSQEGWKRHNQEKYNLHTDPSLHYCSMRRTPLVCAHGGDVQSAPPNTIAAFESALDAGVGCIEVDASLTHDDVLVALHNRDLQKLLSITRNRRKGLGAWTLGPRGSLGSDSVAQFTWSQLETLRWDDDEKVATLRQVLDLAVAREIAVTVDVKLRDFPQFEGNEEAHEEISKMAQHVLRDLRATRCGKSCTAWSKSDMFAETMLSLDPSQRVGIVAWNNSQDAQVLGKDQVARHSHLKIDIVGAHYGMATPRIVAEARDAGREFHVWTADTPEMMSVALDSGADAVVTSHPRALLEAIEARAAVCEDRRKRAS